MKKIFTLIAMTILAVGGVNAQTKLTLGGQGENGEHSWGWTAVYGAEANLKFTSQWGEFKLATTDVTEGATYKLVVEAANSKINLRINNTSGNDADAQFIAVSQTEITGTIPANTASIELQGTEAGEELHVLSFEINNAQTTYSQNWGVAMLSGKYTTSKWAELYLVGAAAFEKQDITITFNEAVPADALQLKVYKTDGSDGYPPIPAGTSATISITDAVKAISLQAKDAYTIDIASATTVDPSTTGIDAVKNSVKQDGVRYNLAGQKVADSYKGIVIVNGRKMIVK